MDKDAERMNDKLIISKGTSLFNALRIMDEQNSRLLIICDKERYFYGLISIGDIQRAILNKKSMDMPVDAFVREDILYATEDDAIDELKRIMRKERIEFMPIISTDNKLVRVVNWEEVFDDDIYVKNKVNLPVVIMAGGQGMRLRPLTNMIPKPLIPVSDRTILEEIIRRFQSYGCRQFYISVNYMADTIKRYMMDKTDSDVLVRYVEEFEPMGTGGALFYVKEEIESTFFVSNCDVLIDVDLSELIDYHKINNNDMTLVSVIKNYRIPYGTIETKQGGVMTKLTEKPSITYQINAGLYVIEPTVLDLLRKNTRLDITAIAQRLLEIGKKVGVYPIPEKQWVDIGNWDSYVKTIIRNADQRERGDDKDGF